MKVTLDSRPDISSQDIWLSRLKTIFIEKVNTDISRDGCLDLLKWIKKSDFFTCPASSRFHSNFLGGLCYHTLAVYSCLNRLIKAHSLEKSFSAETIAIVSLFHDLCKVNTYEVSYRNVKNEETGKWEKKPYWFVNDIVPIGHGEKSVSIIQSFMHLSIEEILAIRWHMLWSWDSPSNPSINSALLTSPLVVLMANADHEASLLYEYDEKKRFPTMSLEFETSSNF